MLSHESSPNLQLASCRFLLSHRLALGRKTNV